MQDREKIGRMLIEALPHARALGMELVAFGEGLVEMRLPYDEKLIGDPETGVIHGGAVSALMDTCAGAAVMGHPQGSTTTATLDLRIDYMRPATPG
ncbi:MAG TPA: PaaI family thioesterase, partial [Rhodobacteraceae bacterium]|nr:PaaI family thioesterase [Paracoccaceae bacterium]